MDKAKDTVLALNVHLVSHGSSAHPRAANYTNASVAKGIAYLDFGFIEPALVSAIAKTAKNGQATPKPIEGQLVTRVAMGVDVLLRLQQQIQQLLIGLHNTSRPKPSKTTS